MVGEFLAGDCIAVHAARAMLVPINTVGNDHTDASAFTHFGGEYMTATVIKNADILATSNRSLLRVTRVDQQYRIADQSTQAGDITEAAVKQMPRWRADDLQRVLLRCRTFPIVMIAPDLR